MKRAPRGLSLGLGILVLMPGACGLAWGDGEAVAISEDAPAAVSVSWDDRAEAPPVVDDSPSQAAKIDVDNETRRIKDLAVLLKRRDAPDELQKILDFLSRGAKLEWTDQDEARLTLKKESAESGPSDRLLLLSDKDLDNTPFEFMAPVMGAREIAYTPVAEQSRQCHTRLFQRTPQDLEDLVGRVKEQQRCDGLKPYIVENDVLQAVRSLVGAQTSAD